MLSLKQKALCFNQFAKTLNAGFSLAQSLRLVMVGMPQQPLLEKVTQQVDTGQTLTAALQGTHLFDAWTLSLIKTAEYSGGLPLICEKLAIAAETQQRRNRYRRSASFSFLILLAGTTVVLTTLAGLGTIATLGWILLIDGLGILLLIAPAAHPVRQQLPILSQFQETEAMLQLTQLSLPLTCGVSILAALELLNPHVPDPALRQLLQKAAKTVKTGRLLSQSLQGKVPDLVMQYVRTGEATGNLEQMFEKLAEHYDDRLETLLKRTQAILRPLSILGLGAIVLILGIQLLKQLITSLPG
jgi:type II secretory pathway component PulF